MATTSPIATASPADRTALSGRSPAEAGDLTDLRQPAAQAFRLLQVGFVVAPILFGLDKFLNLLTDWTQYLAPLVPGLLGLSAQTFMYGVGVVEVPPASSSPSSPATAPTWSPPGCSASSSTSSSWGSSWTWPCATSACCSGRSPSPASPRRTPARRTSGARDRRRGPRRAAARPGPLVQLVLWGREEVGFRREFRPAGGDAGSPLQAVSTSSRSRTTTIVRYPPVAPPFARASRPSPAMQCTRQRMRCLGCTRPC